MVNGTLGFDFSLNLKIKSIFETNGGFLQKKILSFESFNDLKKVESIYIAWKTKMKQDLTSLSTHVNLCIVKKISEERNLKRGK